MHAAPSKAQEAVKLFVKNDLGVLQELQWQFSGRGLKSSLTGN